MAVNQPWQMGPLLRLLGGVLVCVFLGSVVALALRYPVADIHRPTVFGCLLLGSGTLLLGALWMVASPWPERRLEFRFLVFALLAYGGISCTAVAQRMVGQPLPGSEAMQLGITALSFQGAVLILVGRLVQEHDLGWSQAFGFEQRLGYAAGIGFLAAGSIIPVAWGLQYFSVKVMNLLDWHPEAQYAVNIFKLTGSWSDRVVLGLVALVLAPIAEELLFRGVLYPALKAFGLPRFSFCATATIFALIHFNAATFLSLFVFACLLNVLYELTGNLVACIVAHATFNAINLLMLIVFDTLIE